MGPRGGCCGQPAPFADAFTRVRYFRTPGSRVTVMSGWPAAGKDSWVAAHRQGAPVLSFDDARETLGLRHGENEGQAVHWVVDRAKALLRRGEDFVWNATHLSRHMRQRSLDLLFAYGAEVEVVDLELPEAEALRRNARRDTTVSSAVIGRVLHR